MADRPEADGPDPDAPEMGPEVGDAIADTQPAAGPATGVSEDGVISPTFISRFIGAVGDGDKPFLWRTIKQLHPADGADLLEHLQPEAFRKAIHLIDRHLPAEVVAELTGDVRHAALEELTDDAIAGMVETLESDDASFILEDIGEDRRNRILGRVSATDRAAIETSLAFDEESAGRLMQRDFVAAPVFWKVGQMLDHLRGQSDEQLPDVFYEVYIVDPAFRLQGAVPVSTLLRSERERALNEIMREAVVVRPEMKQEEVAYLFQQYNLASAPVVDDAGRLTGVITIDDIVDVIQEENREDILALSGVRDDGGVTSVIAAVKARIPWLGVNLATAFIASTVVSLFAEVIDQHVALAFLMPVVAGLGGNAGSQALAVAVRGIAERDLDGPRALRAIRREAFTAIINGVAIASIAALVVMVWFHDPRLSAVIFLAMSVTFTWAGLVGILAPLTLKRLGADPAVSSSVFVLTSIDIMAFFAFLGLASLMLA